MRLVTGREGQLCLYWLVDEADGIIADAKFQVFGPPLLIAVGEIASELVLRKNYDQAFAHFGRSSRQLRARPEEAPAFPKEAASYLNQAISAIDKAVHQCIDIPYAATDFDITPH